MIENRDKLFEQNIHLRDYFDVLYRRRMIFTSVFVFVFFSVALYTFLSKPIYEASSTLYIQGEQNKGILEELDIIPPSVSIESEIEIVKSRTIAEEVIEQLHLNWKAVKEGGDLSFTIEQFTSIDEEPRYTITLTGATSYEVRNINGDVIGRGSSGSFLEGDKISLKLSEVKGEQGNTFTLELLPMGKVLERFYKKLTVLETRKNTSVMRIVYEDTEPVIARDVVNFLVTAYLNRRITFKTEEAAKTINFIDQQLTNIKSDLDRAEKEIEKYKATSGLVELDAKAAETISIISDLEKKKAEIALERKQAQFAIESIISSMNENNVYNPTLIKSNPIITSLSAKLADLEVQKSALMGEFTQNHPAIANINAQIHDIYQKLIDFYKENLDEFSKQESAYNQTIETYENIMKKLPSAEFELAGLMRNAKVNSEIYTFMLQKREESRIARASTISNINIIDPAIIPDEPIKPKILINLILGFVGGLMISLLLTFFLDYLDDTIKDPDTAQSALDIPLLVVIPYISEINGDKDGLRKKMLITHLKPKSGVSEVFRSLRTNIHFSSLTKKQQVMLVTSSFPAEGKTTIFSNLSVTLAQTNKRVLIIDCDLRRSFLHEIFGHSKKPGITDLLAGDISLESCAHKTGIYNVDLITAGTTPPNPAEILGSDGMSQLLNTLKKDYDYILLDAPPLLAVTDAHLLASMADMIIVVLEVGRVPIKVARRMSDLLRKIGTPLTGVVVNDKTAMGDNLYGYSDKYYSYAYYSENYLKSPEKSRSLWKRFTRR